MGEEKETGKQPISKDTIFKVMLYITYIVSGVFLLKNIVGKNLPGMVAIGLCLVIFTAILLILRGLKRDIKEQQFMTSMGILFVVFIISQFSGESSSDDFLLYMAIIALTGLYLRPKYTLIQVIIADIMLAVQYFIHPEKAGALGQYITCLLIFTLAGVILYLVIKRGRAFIEVSQNRAEEAESLLASLQQLGEELEHNFENSSAGIEGLQKTNDRLNQNAEELRVGSTSITQGARVVEDTCDSAQIKMEETEKRVAALTDGVRSFENSLETNRKNMAEMNQQMEVVQSAMGQVNQVFQLLEEQMKEIYKVTEQLKSISSSTTILALNASIEAARAGQSGAGFAVVASKVQNLAVDSNKCSEQVAGVVGQMQHQIQETTRQLEESELAINASLGTLQGLQDGFSHLTDQFGNLYQDIEAQNENVNQVNSIFETLKNDISEMSHCSEENQKAVEDIAEAMDVYKENMDQMIQDTKQVCEMSANLLNLTRQ